MLDRPFDGDTSATNTQWKVKKRFYDLPEDCLELLYLGHRDYPYVSVTGSQNPYGKSTAILPRREEDLDLKCRLHTVLRRRIHNKPYHSTCEPAWRGD